MDYFDFFLLLNDQTTNYLCCLAIAIIVYTVVFRKTFLSLLDPFTFPLIGSGFGFYTTNKK